MIASASRFGVRSLLLAMATVAAASISVPLDAQELSGPEHKRIEEMLAGVRREIAEHYYDSTMGGVNFAAVHDSAAVRVRDARALDAGLSAIAWMTLELHDSHTFFIPPQRTVAVEYGWEMAMVGDTCFVLRVRKGSDAEVHGLRPGDQVISINGYSPTRASLWQLQYLFWVLRPQRSLHIIVRAPGASPRELDLESKVRERSRIVDLTGADGGRDVGRLVRDGERDADDYKSFTVEYGNQILIWKLPTFEIPIDAVRDAIRNARGRKALVLDLRGDGGGYEKVMLDLISRLSRDSVVLGTVQERQKRSPLVARGSGKDAFDGQLYVLVDSRSASASELLARVVQLRGRGKVFGDRTAGAVMRAQYRPLTLGMETRVFYGVQVTEADVIMSDGGRLEGIGVTPDEIILPTAADLATKRDPVLARALTLAGMPTDAPKAGVMYPSKP